MPNGRRCDMGCETWPDKLLYQICPACGEPTTVNNNVHPLSEKEAMSLLAKYEFEEYYARRCALRNIPADGPLPEDYNPYIEPLKQRKAPGLKLHRD